MAKGRLKRLVREVKMVEIGGLSDMMTKNWSQLDLDSLSSSSWSVMDTESHIKGLRSPVTRPPSLTMRLNTKLRSGELVLRSDPLTIGYPDTTLFVTQPLDLRRKECAALIGPNGTGKTTLLRTVLEQIEPLTGELRLGASLRLGYFAQAHEKLDPNKSVLDELLDYQHMDIADARNHLARYLFRNEDVYKPIHMLSGGERGRLALSLLALDQANFLLMDEPTNHLDIPTQEVLQDALEHFDGTILMVSHDRYLISRLATQIWSLENGKMRVFKGTYEQYMEAKAAETEAKRAVAAVQRAERRNSQQGNRAEINEARKRAKAIAEMETKVEALEERLAEISEKLQAASDAQDMEKIHKLSEAYASTSDELDAAMEAWAEMAE
ncbi:MAG: ATP-binding cassette domain-containing protein [Chloroflexota bacterium]